MSSVLLPLYFEVAQKRKIGSLVTFLRIAMKNGDGKHVSHPSSDYPEYKTPSYQHNMKKT